MTARQPALSLKVRCQSLIDGNDTTRFQDPSRRWVFSVRTVHGKDVFCSLFVEEKGGLYAKEQSNYYQCTTFIDVHSA